MLPLQPIYIAGSSVGLETDIKPFLLPDQGYPVLENAYVYREQVRKREGLQLVGRLRRILEDESAGNYSTINGTNVFNIFTGLGLASSEPDANLQLGDQTTITIDLDAPISQTLTDNTGSGTLVITGVGPITAATINYATGDVTITANAALGPAAVEVSLAYYPQLPSMSIPSREITSVNLEQTIFFDTKYAYIFNSGQFQEFIPGTEWNGSDDDFYWATNYRGSTPASQLFFITNFVSTATNPMRYTNGAAWTDFAPLVSSSDTLFQAKILIPYYGRLLALNVYEGTTVGGYAAAVNIYNRCRFSQLGDPTAADAWRSDQFGKGGYIDAPTNEAIISAKFFKNTLLVNFERSTWQLRYVGEYGLPFIWERISSDFGCESAFSTVLFDDFVLQVGDRAITAATANSVRRIDEKIPDLVFNFANNTSGKERVQGIRDFQRELVFWSYVDPDMEGIYPNKTLVYNYQNRTFAKFRNNVTCYGELQSIDGVTWDSQTVFWDDLTVTWDDVQDNAEFPRIVCGNQQGFIHYYGYTTLDESSLAIQDIDLTVTPVVVTSPKHNLSTAETILIHSTIFTPDDPGLNGFIYRVTRIDDDSFSISQWNGNAYADVSSDSLSTYIGNGLIILFPKLEVQSKDFNPYQDKGLQVKLSQIDFQLDAIPQSALSITVFMNSSPAVDQVLLIGDRTTDGALTIFGFITGVSLTNPCVITSPNHGLRNDQQISITNIMGTTQLNGANYTVTYIDSNTFSLNGIDATGFTAYISQGNWQRLTSNSYVPASYYAWHRFYCPSFGQYIRIQISYDDSLMNNIQTHMNDWVMNAVRFFVRPGGKSVLL